MGTSTTYDGTLAIEPPLTWPEVRETETWSGHPDHHNLGDFRHSGRYGVRLVVDAEAIDTPEGYLMRHAGTSIKIVGDELRHDEVMSQLRQLARQFGDTHRFTGLLTCYDDYPGSSPFRVRIIDTAVQEVRPVTFWPDDPDVLARIRLVLGQHSGVNLDDADNIAARVFDILVASYEKKG